MTANDSVRNSERASALPRITAQEAQVVDALRRQEAVSRTDISRLTHWSRPKVTSIVDRMISRGFLMEVGEGDSAGGRRPSMLRINNQLGYLVGVDIGATSMDLALADLSAQVLARDSGPADVRSAPGALLGEVQGRLRTMIQRQGLQPEQILGVGVGVPGPVDFHKGVLVAPPLMPAWEDFAIREFFQHAFPRADVWVDNDVNMMALGELRAGAGRGVENFIFVKIGTGIGAGVICHGLVHRGSSGSAGDIGHIRVDANGPICHCGNIGCLEMMAAGPAIAARAVDAAQQGRSPILTKKLAANGGTLRPEDVGAAAREGDRAAIEIIQSSGQLIGGVLAGLVNFFNPSLILIGGGVAHIGNQLLASVRQEVLRRSTALATRDLVISYLPRGVDAGVIGAVHLALDHLFVVDDRGKAIA
ncbi:MAG TPA: ROK family transcriptional regulator [Chloroflexia bacterium]|nr:ROK family transcriptional regulator [Chloroflexia bacterium]